MLSRDELQGFIPPMVTPLKANGAIDKAGFQRVVTHHLEGGADGLFVLGSTGEGPSLSDSRAAEVVAETVRLSDGRVPVLAGIIGCSFERILEKARLAAEEGAAAVVATTPVYYDIYRDAEILDYYRRLAEEAPLPVVIYNIPAATQVKIAPKVLQELASVPSILGVKDSTGDWAHFQEILFRRDDLSFRVMQGKEELSGASLIFGADGIVSGIGNLHPRLATDLYRAGSRGDLEATRALQKQMDELFRVIKGRPWLLAIKTAMNLLGLCKATATRPFDRLEEQDVREIEAVLQENGLSIKDVDEKMEEEPTA